MTSKSKDGVAEYAPRIAFDTLPSHLAVLDTDGTILSTNRAWREFGEANGIQIDPATLGVNYLEVADAADDPYATRAATGLRAVLRGDREQFELEYPCHSPEEQHWYLLRAVPIRQNGDRYVTVAHVDITERKAREQALREAYEICAASEESFSHRVDALLELVRDTVGTEYAVLSRVEGDEYSIEAVAASSDAEYIAGKTAPLEDVPVCKYVVETKQRVVSGSVPGMDLEDGDFGVEIASYLGTPVLLDGDVYGTFCLYSTDPWPEAFSEWAVTFVELLSDWVARELVNERYSAHMSAIDTAFPDLGFLIDWDGQYLECFASPDSWDLLFADRENLLGQTVTDVLPEKPANLLLTTVREAIETGQSQTIEYQLSVPAGTRWFEARVAPVTDEEYGRDSAVVISRDITDRKEHEQKLAYRTALLEAQADTTIDGLLLVDSDQQVLYYNDRFLEMWDIPEHVAEDRSDETLREYVHDLLADPGEFQARIEDLYGTDERSRETIRLTDGRWFDRYSAPVVGEEGTRYGRLWTFRDITERKQRERTLREQRDELAQLERLNTLVREITQALQETTTRDAIESAVCTKLTESELYRSVWIGTKGSDDAGGTTVIPQTVAGVSDISKDDIPTEELRIARRALQTDETILVSDEGTDLASKFEVHPAETDSQPTRVAVPLPTEQMTYGVLMVTALPEHTISDSEWDILADFGRNIALAMQRVQSQRSLTAEILLDLEVVIPEPETMLGEVTEELDCELSIQQRIATGDGAPLYYLRVADANPTRVCNRMERSEDVATCTVVRENEDRQSSLLEVEFGQVPQLPHEILTDYGGEVTAARATTGTVQISVELPPEVNLRTVLDQLRKITPSVRIQSKQHVDRQQRTVSTIQNQIDDKLSQKQKATLKAAYSRGYYAWPRDSTVEELADTFDVSAPALHYRLRKSHETILSALIDAE